MSTKPATDKPSQSDCCASLRTQYGCGEFEFSGTQHALYELHLASDRVVDPAKTSARDRFAAFAHSVRDVLSQRWVLTESTYARQKPKRIYYISMEFLLGRSLSNNIVNLLLDGMAKQAIERRNLDWADMVEQEADAGLGNGGLGRLAACFLDSMATMQLPAMGYGLRYEYGIFQQFIKHGWQVEKADHWLRFPDPWEVARPEEKVEVEINCGFEVHGGRLRVIKHRPSTLIGIPFDRPVVGYGGKTINTLRLWGAAAPNEFGFQEFSEGDFVGALTETLAAETLTRVLYPDDSTSAGEALRFLQEYFLVACSLADLLRRFKQSNENWQTFPEKVAIQLNDTHPALAVCELMRLLLDEANLGWRPAWDITQRCLAYTNHTLLPEALERWPMLWFQTLLPRQFEIVCEINRRFLDSVRERFPEDDGRLGRMSLIDTSGGQVRMANLAIVGSHSTNGVAAIHSSLLRQTTVRDFAEMYPERFNNKTNGVTPRRWLRLANASLARLITDAIGEGWLTNLAELRRLEPFAEDKAFREEFAKTKLQAKVRFAEWVKRTSSLTLDPDYVFDAQVKRIHEYKRQLLNALRIIVLYNRLRERPDLEIMPRTFIFAGKAAPAYRLAKLIIKLINNIAGTLDGDSCVHGRLKVVFLPNYGVSMAEYLIPASDISNQISTAGYEASGTSNMKFMMNGALTIGTRDGATLEMAEEAGPENLFLFGLTAAEVSGSRGWYSPYWHYQNEPDTRAALDLLFSGHFSLYEMGVFEPLRHMLLEGGDHYMHLADLKSYVDCDCEMMALYNNRDEWVRKAIVNVARSGKFSSDRTIAEYARDIWDVQPCPVS